MNNNAFLTQGFDYKGRSYRPMTATTQGILQIINSPIYTNDPSQSTKGLLDYLFMHSTPLVEIRKLAQDKEAFDDAVWAFGDTINQEDLQELAKLINKEHEAVASVMVKPLIPEKKTPHHKRR